VYYAELVVKLAIMMSSTKYKTIATVTPYLASVNKELINIALAIFTM